MLPNSALSSTVLPAPFLPPRTLIRYSPIAGQSDVHMGGIAIADASQGLSVQRWTAFILGPDIWLSAPNTPAFKQLVGVNAAWVGLAFDQNMRPFITYADKGGSASYYWFDTLLPGFRTSAIPGSVNQVFASLDDQRPELISSSDVILAYVRAGTLYFRAQRERFGVEHALGTAPARLVQIGMNKAFRFQFAFQNVQANKVLPPAEFNPGAAQ